MSVARGPIENDSLSRLPPAQLREMREAFQVLDRDNDGIVNREDVADVLRNLGTDSLTTISDPLLNLHFNRSRFIVCGDWAVFPSGIISDDQSTYFPE